MDDKEKITTLEEENEVLKKRISKLSSNGIRNMDARLEDLEKNIDIMAVAFNAAVVNQFNKNHDGMATDTALAVSEYFKLTRVTGKI